MQFKKYDTLVISGGSILGFYILGSLQYCYENNIINNITTIFSTSVGSILSYLLCIGYSPIDIFSILSTKRELFNKLSNLNLLNLINGKGVTDFIYINNFLEELTLKKFEKLLSLKELYELSGKNLFFTTYNESDNILEYINYINYPDIPVLTAIRMSCNIPEFFEKFSYKNKFYIDGGILDNFPIYEASKYSDNILGINIPKTINFKEDENFLERIYRRFTIPLIQLEKITNKNINKPIDIINIYSDKNNYILDFSIKQSLKYEMFYNGYKTSEDYFIQKMKI